MYKSNHLIQAAAHITHKKNMHLQGYEKIAVKMKRMTANFKITTKKIHVAITELIIFIIALQSHDFVAPHISL